MRKRTRCPNAPGHHSGPQSTTPATETVDRFRKGQPPWEATVEAEAFLNAARADRRGCFQGNCVLDDDCGSGGWCSPSAIHVGPTCMEGISPGSVGYFCRTADDECLDDGDCGSSGIGACIFSVEAMHWVCQELLCTG